MHAGDLLSKRAHLTPHREALLELETGRRFTYAQLNERANRTANFLRAQCNVRPGDRVSILAHNSVVYVDLLYGLCKIGAIFAPLNWRLVARELAYIVNTDQVTVTSTPFEIYDSESAAFPREPYILKFSSGGQNFVVIDNHLKCCGNGEIDPNDAWDEETRRQSACILLDQYIRASLPNDNVIVIGDWNDELTDPVGENVFLNFSNISTEVI